MNNLEVDKTEKFDLTLFSIGHSNHTLEHFIALLTERDIACVVDVRSVPYPKYSQHFSRDNLSVELPRYGIEYIWMGVLLGGRREDMKTSIGTIREDEFDDNPSYHLGIVKLMRKALVKPTAMMCSEEDPRKCHRHKIIAQTLLHRRIPECSKLDSIDVIHIRGDGTTEDASAVPTAFQPSLFV